MTMTPAADVTNVPSLAALGRIRPAVSANALPAAKPEAHVRHDVHRFRPRAYDHRMSPAGTEPSFSGAPHAPRPFQGACRRR